MNYVYIYTHMYTVVEMSGEVCLLPNSCQITQHQIALTLCPCGVCGVFVQESAVLAEDLSRDVAPEKFRSKAKSVGGFVFGQLGDVFFLSPYRGKHIA